MNINKAVVDALKYTGYALYHSPPWPFYWYLGVLPNSVSSKF